MKLIPVSDSPLNKNTAYKYHSIKKYPALIFKVAGKLFVDLDEWEMMALRHGIFFQGGYPLSVMTENERNVDGHAAHLRAGGTLVTMPGMPGR